MFQIIKHALIEVKNNPSMLSFSSSLVLLIKEKNSQTYLTLCGNTYNVLYLFNPGFLSSEIFYILW